MSIQDVIERARREPPYAPLGHPFPDLRIVCKVLEPVDWNRSEIERDLGVKVPADLATLWDNCGGMILCGDNLYQQSGLIVLSPLEVVAMNWEYLKRQNDRTAPGDLVFAEFYGDLRLVLVRNDQRAPDYGTIVVAEEIDPRSEWHAPARSLEEFLSRFMDAHGDAYWDVHYEQILAARRRNTN